MKLVLLASVLCLASVTLADKSSPSQGLSHVVRVGRNGRQVIHRQGNRQQQGRGRRVVRKQRKERQFLPAAPVTFSLPPAPLPASALRLVPAPAVPHHAVRVAAPPVPAFTPTLFNPFAPVRAAPLHSVHAVPAPVVAAPPLPIAPPPPAPLPFVPAPPAPLAPAPAVVVEARQVPLEYGAPSTVAPEVRTNYLAPSQDYLPAVEEVVEVEVAREAPTEYLPAVEEAPRGYLSPAPEVVEVEVAKQAPTQYLPAVEEVKQAPSDYLPAVEEVKQAPSDYLPAVEEAPRAYLSPVQADTGYLSPAPAQEVVEVEVAREAPAEYVPNVAANRRATAKPKPIGFVRNILNSPSANPEFDYDFEGDNKIQQKAEGRMRKVGESEVVVMSGSYEYVGPDNNLYRVDWIADENGFQPTATHIPQPVAPNHPEVAAAVRAQLAFAKKEDAARARSAASSPSGYLAPEELPGYN